MKPDHAGRMSTRNRVVGVDLARGFALVGMMAVHVFPLIVDDEPTTTALVAAGRSAAMFALLAGVSLAFLSGGREVVRGADRQAARWGLVVRGLLIGLIGLLLGFTDVVEVILLFYAVMFLLAIPLLALSARVLVAIAAGLVTLGPVLLVLAARAGVEFGTRPDPTLVTLFTDPIGVLGQLFITGSYPIVVYMGFVCAGLAIGRMDLGSPRFAGILLAGGAAVAVLAQAVSWVLLYPVGGMMRLLAYGDHLDHATQAAAALLWDPTVQGSWWYLALASPHAGTQLDMLHSLGSGAAVLGACLLVTRVGVLRRVLTPLAVAGSMTLTLYSAHILVLQTGLLDEYPALVFFVLVVGALIFAVLWKRWQGQGPLERLVADASRRARRVPALRQQARPKEPVSTID